MSYDFRMYADVGGGRRAYLDGPDYNMTSNVSGMWRKAIPSLDGLAGLDGKTGAECLAALKAGIAAMEEDPASYEAMNPANGWGSYETALETVRTMAEWARDYPLARFSVSR